MTAARRIEIAQIDDDPRSVGRPIMSDHNMSARLWAAAAVVSVPLAGSSGLGWWLPLHLALVGAASQAIVGGQLMFSATLGLARGPSRRTVLAQLALMNVGGASVVGGRLLPSEALLGVGATLFLVGVAWAAWQVHLLWKRSVNRRFVATGTFYRLAAASILIGASIGAALGMGVFTDLSYLTHRNIHMTVNVFGWAGLTIVGTAVTLLPTIMHVRAPTSPSLRPVPWLMFGGLLAYATAASFSVDLLAGAGLVIYAAGLAIFGLYLRRIVQTPRRRRVPSAALHLGSALGWLIVATSLSAIFTAVGDDAAVRDIIVVGGAAGAIFQALLGAWSFLLPSLRPPIPDRRRRELVAMELAGRVQVAAYNAGLILVLIGLRFDSDLSLAGICIAWLAAAVALTKTWVFPLLAELPVVRARSERWWAPPEP